MMIHAWSLEWLFSGVSLAVVVEAVTALRITIVGRNDFKGTDGPRLDIANLNVEMAAVFLAIAVLLFGLSVASVLLRPPPPDYRQVPQTVVLLAGDITFGLLLLGASLRSTAVRNRLMKLAEDLERAKHEGGTP